MAKPKLALIPATQGTKLYSVLPADGVGDFNFSRNSAATRINKDGLIETVAVGKSRLNYPLIDGVVNGCPSHLLEPTRSNLNTYSDPTIAQQGNLSYASVTYQDDFNWGLGNVIKNAIVFGDNSTTRYAYYNSTVVSGTEYALSFIIKMDDNSVPIPATDFLMVLAGTSFTYGYNVESYGNNIYRISVSGTAGASNTANGILKVASNSTKGFTISGFQIEQGSYATSYIPNYGNSAGITRSAETANGSGDAATFNDSEGVLMVETKFLEDGRLGVSNADNSDQVIIGNSGGVFYRITENNSNPITQYIGVSELENHKIALKYKSTQTSIFVDGFELDTNSTSYSLSGLNELSFTAQNSAFYGNTKQVQYYDSALTDSELETLTSWVSFSDMANGQLYTIQ